MPQDAFTLRYLCEELNELLSGGKINRIVQPSSDEIVFTVYTGKRTEKLLIDVNPASPRMGITEEEKESPLTAPNFCMLLRKHLLNAQIDGISLVGFDRIVKIDITPSSEFFDAERKTLFVELMGRYSNVILTEKGKVLGGNRGINCFDNGVRPLIVGHEYKFPPVGEKRLPQDASLESLFFGAEEKALPAIIAENVQGIALSTAEELVREYFEARSCRGATAKSAENDGATLLGAKNDGAAAENAGDCRAATQNTISDGKDFCDFFVKFLYDHKKSPCVTFSGGAVKDVCAFPYKSQKAEAIKNFERLIYAESFYFSERGKAKRFSALKERLNSVVAAALKKAQKRLAAVSAREKDASSAEENRIKGELILANIYKFKGGETEAELYNYYDNTTLKVTLDKSLSPAANAERYYKKYNKQKRSLVALAPERERAEKDIDYLKSIQGYIGFAETEADLLAVKEEAVEAGLIKEKAAATQKKKTAPKTKGREYVIEGFKVVCGRNNLENDAIVYGAKGEDLWLHAKDYHSSHVIISSEGKAVPEKVVAAAAEICAYYSQGRGGGRVEVVYTRRKFLKKPPKSKAGFFVYSEYKSVYAEPNNGEKYIKTE